MSEQTPKIDNSIQAALGQQGHDGLFLPKDPEPDDAMWLGEPTAEERHATALQTAYITGGAALGGVGISHADVDAWFASQPPDEQEWLASGRKETAERTSHVAMTRVKVEGAISKSAPELLVGELPKGLADKIGLDYVLAINQSGLGSVAEAQQAIKDDNGVNMANYSSLDKEFELIHKSDPDRAKTVVVSGYGGIATSGKFVVAVPIQGGEGGPYEKAKEAYLTDGDMSVPRTLDGATSAVNQKYVAGFIDGSGTFYANAHFMDEKPAELVVADSYIEQPAKLPDDWL